MTLQELIDDATKTAIEKGWNDNRTFGDDIALVHSELSEALEEYRNGKEADELYFNDADKPEGIPAELADVVIRVAMISGMRGIDLVGAVDAKLAYNKTRTFRHGGKRL